MKLLVISDTYFANARSREFMERAAKLNGFVNVKFVTHLDAAHAIKEWNPMYIIVCEYDEDEVNNEAKSKSGYFTWQKIEASANMRERKTLRMGEKNYAYHDYVNAFANLYHELFDLLLDRGADSSIENIE